MGVAPKKIRVLCLGSPLAGKYLSGLDLELWVCFGLCMPTSVGIFVSRTADRSDVAFYVSKWDTVLLLTKSGTKGRS